ncbi:methylated-DNA--[protein]-cysteine S-methyltransferase [bacterium]|nr:methylated-DNA--[protein]-cysteine S-methyltransferase [bacterium]
MKQLYYRIVDTPAGAFCLAVSDRGIVSVLLPSLTGEPARHRLRKQFPGAALLEERGAAADGAEQIQRYFSGGLREFSLDLDPRMTPFQEQVLAVVRSIPFGETTSYGSIARKLGKPGAARAVGGANHANPLPLIIPCHRVIGSNGALTGFGGGLGLKAALLRWEKEVLDAEKNSTDPASGFDWHIRADR